MKSWQSLPLLERHGDGGALLGFVAAIGVTPSYAQTSKSGEKKVRIAHSGIARGAIDLIIAARGGIEVLPVLQNILTRAPDSHFSTCCYVF